VLDWRPYFPESQPRPLQTQVLDLLVKEWDNYDNFVLELPTGVGKSAVAVTIARWVDAQRPKSHMDEEDYHPYSTYISTTSLELQEQYFNSYSKLGLKKLYAADNFSCNRGKGMTCGEGKRICSSTKTSCPGLCSYKEAKKRFIKSPFGILNLAYYVNETYYAHQLVPRHVNIYDEAHTIGDLVKNFVSIEITDKALSNYLLQPPKPDFEDGSYNVTELIKWVNDNYLKKVEVYLAKLWEKVKNWEGDFEDRKYLTLSGEATELDKHACRIRRIVNRISDALWVAERQEGSILLTPVRPTEFMREILFDHPDKNVLLSATILDSEFMMKEYDLDPKRTLVFKAASPFPVENRPIYYWPVGRLNHRDLRGSMKPFSDAVNALLDEHKDQRGIIFVNSYSQAEELMRQVGSDRLITHSNSRDKPRMMDIHIRSQNTVIVSPSMHEGVDLRDDLSRFQILLKMPFPSLGSKSVQVRADRWPEWYAYTTSLLLIQCTGRSVRSDKDYATSYVLDSNFGWWSDKWSQFLPRYWLDALQTIE
jgi:ATP-dependent DNA helicase DinG